MQSGQNGTVAPPANTILIASARGRYAIAASAVLLLLGIVAAFLLFTSAGILHNNGTVNQSAAPGASYVVVGTEETAIPTTLAFVPPTHLPTTIATTRTAIPTITKSITCSSDTVNCNNKCVDLRTDNKNCGLCNTSCAIYESCTNGRCMTTCVSGYTSCTGGCYDLLTNAKHCGDCLNACPVGLICYYGQCSAPATPMAVPV
jgi:hypothetical protein